MSITLVGGVGLALGVILLAVAHHPRSPLVAALLAAGFGTVIAALSVALLVYSLVRFATHQSKSHAYSQSRVIR